VVLLSSSASSFGQDFEKQSKAVQILRDATNDICTKVDIAGKNSSYEARGEIDAAVGGVFKKITDLGVHGGGNLHDEEYKNVVQKDLADLLKHNMDCRRDVFDLLANKLLSTAAPTHNHTNIAKPSSLAELEPYVSLSSRIEFDGSRNKFKCDLNLQNTENRWIHIISLRIKWLEQVEPLDPNRRDPFDDLKLPDASDFSMSLGPNQSLSWEWEIPFRELDDIANGHIKYDLAAWLKYKDSANPNSVVHQTQLYEYANVDRESRTLYFYYRPKHNCVDNDCPK
jgi:hypothetical protein